MVFVKIYEALKFEFYSLMTMPVMRIENTMSLIYSPDNLNITASQLLSRISSSIP